MKQNVYPTAMWSVLVDLKGEAREQILGSLLEAANFTESKGMYTRCVCVLFLSLTFSRPLSFAVSHLASYPLAHWRLHRWNVFAWKCCRNWGRRRSDQGWSKNLHSLFHRRRASRLGSRHNNAVRMKLQRVKEKHIQTLRMSCLARCPKRL